MCFTLTNTNHHSYTLSQQVPCVAGSNTELLLPHQTSLQLGPLHNAHRQATASPACTHVPHSPTVDCRSVSERRSSPKAQHSTACLCVVPLSVTAKQTADTSTSPHLHPLKGGGVAQSCISEAPSLCCCRCFFLRFCCCAGPPCLRCCCCCCCCGAAGNVFIRWFMTACTHHSKPQEQTQEQNKDMTRITQ
mgnify:CR=1 FL=1